MSTWRQPTMLLTLALLASSIGCGGSGTGGPTGDGPDNPDSAVPDVAKSDAPASGPADVADRLDSAIPDGPTVDARTSSLVDVASVLDSAVPDGGKSDGAMDVAGDPGAAGAPRVPCTDDPSAIFSGRDNYLCSSCGGDVIYPLACIGGYLACAKSYPGGADAFLSVPNSVYVVDRQDSASMTGQCAYLAPSTYPGFMLADPLALTTARSPSLPLTLKSMVSWYSPSGFAVILKDRPRGEQAIRSLVVLTDMLTGKTVPYSIGDPVRDGVTALETLTLTPVTPLAANAWYRVTVLPGESQSFVSCHTFGRSPSGWLTVSQTTDFYTYSRPMISDMFIPYKEGGKGYIQFDFTEALSAADLTANPAPVVLVDGVAVSGTNSSTASYVQLALQTVPQSFSEISLRIPKYIRSVQGGALSDGVAGNPSATLDGDWAVYTFKASDMVLTDNNLVKRWYYTGP